MYLWWEKQIRKSSDYEVICGKENTMIRHICMFKYQEENREANIEETFRRAEILKEIPTLKHFDIVRNYAEAPESNYEVSLIFDFETMEDLQSYTVHPNHIEFGNFIKSVREARACIDYKL